MTKASLAADLLRSLPQLAYDVAVQRDSPARTISDAPLSELLDLIISDLQVHLPQELVKAARDQLTEICRRSEGSARTFEAAVSNSRELSASKVNIIILGGSIEVPDRVVLDDVRSRASAGGVVRKLAIEATWLSRLIECNIERLSLNHEEMSTRYSLPPITADTFKKLRAESERIGLARRSLRAGDELHMPLPPATVRTTHLDVHRAEVLQKLRSVTVLFDRIKLLKRLRRDRHPDAMAVLFEYALNPTEPLEIREVSCCLLEEIMESAGERDNEPFLQIVSTALRESLKNSSICAADITILLRLLSKSRGATGARSVGEAASEMVSSPDLLASIRGSEQEVALLILLISLAGRSESVTFALDGVAEGGGISHLGEGASTLVRRHAARSIAGQAAGSMRLLELFDRLAGKPNNDEVINEIVELLSADDGNEKVMYQLRSLEVALADEDGYDETTVIRLVRSIRHTRNPKAFAVLTKILLDTSHSLAVRQECAVALKHVRGEENLRILEAIGRAGSHEKVVLLPALQGEPDDQRFVVVLQSLQRSYEPGEPAASLRERVEALKLAHAWRVL